MANAFWIGFGITLGAVVALSFSIVIIGIVLLIARDETTTRPRRRVF